MSLKNPKHRCEHVRADGRRCSMPRSTKHGSLCLHHARLEENLADQMCRTPEAVALVAELLGSRQTLNTETAVNDALAKLFSLRSRKLISARDTMILAYVIQLLLQTLHGVDHEFNRIHNSRAWERILDQAIQQACAPTADAAAGAPSLPAGKGGDSLPSDQSRAPAPRRRKPRPLPATAREFAQQVFAQLASDRAALEESPEEVEVEEEEPATH